MAINSLQDVQNALTQMQTQSNNAFNNLHVQMNAISGMIFDYFKKAVHLINERTGHGASRAFLKGFDPSNRGNNEIDLGGGEGVTWEEIYTYFIDNILPSEYIDIVPDIINRTITIALKLDKTNEAILKNVIGSEYIEIDHSTFESNGKIKVTLNLDKIADYLAENGVAGPQGIQGEQGPQGEQGIQGVQGETGLGLNIKGEKGDPADLPDNPDVGDTWVINGSFYIWDGSDWVIITSIQGPQGIQGEPGPMPDTSQFMRVPVYSANSTNISNTIGGTTTVGSSINLGQLYIDVSGRLGVYESGSGNNKIIRTIALPPASGSGTAPGDGILTIKLGTQTIGTFTANQATNTDTVIDLSSIDMGGGSGEGSLANLNQDVTLTQQSTVVQVDASIRFITVRGNVNSPVLYVNTPLNTYRDLFIINLQNQNLQVYFSDGSTTTVQTNIGGGSNQNPKYKHFVTGLGKVTMNPTEMTMG